MSPPPPKGNAEDPALEHEADHAPLEGDAPGVAPARREAFPKDCRILRRPEFLRIQGQGQRIHGKRLVFQFLPGVGRESRLGLTVSKKVGNAVVRNRIKRWLREAFRRHPELRPRRGDPRRPYDLVITAKRDVADFTWSNVHGEVVQVLSRYLESRSNNKPRARQPPRKAPDGADDR